VRERVGGVKKKIVPMDGEVKVRGGEEGNVESTLEGVRRARGGLKGG